MIKKSNSFSQSYKMPHLDLDDLLQLEGIFKESDSQNYKVQTKDYEYQSINEFKPDGSVIHELSFSINNPYVSLDFNKTNARIYSSNEDLMTVGLISKLNSYLQLKEQKRLWVICRLIDFFGAFLFMYSIYFGIDSWKSNEKIISLIMFTVAIDAVLLIYLDFKKSLREYSDIELSVKINKKSFLQTYKDQLILIVVGALLGAIFTYFLGLIK